MPFSKLAELIADPSKVAITPSKAITIMLGEFERLRAELWSRLSAR
ncbi:MAG: hypothetical protein O7E51_00975 [Acidobacteria bacterium]|nr:hypothetical protein [Acidobacteriota bacterium]